MHTKYRKELQNQVQDSSHFWLPQSVYIGILDIQLGLGQTMKVPIGTPERNTAVETRA